MAHEANANGEFLPGGGEGHFSGYVRPCLKGQARGTLLCFLPVIIDFYIKYQESKLSTGGSTLGSISEVSLWQSMAGRLCGRNWFSRHTGNRVPVTERGCDRIQPPKTWPQWPSFSQTVLSTVLPTPKSLCRFGIKSLMKAAHSRPNSLWRRRHSHPAVCFPTLPGISQSNWQSVLAVIPLLGDRIHPFKALTQRAFLFPVPWQ